MDDDFNVDAAVDEIGSGLGFDTPAEEEVELEVELPKAAETPATPETPAPEAVAAEEPPISAEPSATTDEPPKTWRKEASATWAALPSEAKAEILKRESDIFKGLESYKADATVGKSFKSVAAPYEATMRSAGVSPEQAAARLFQAHHVLGTGTKEQRTGMLHSMAKSYGIDLSPQIPAGEPPYIDPAVAALQSELRGVQSQLAEANQRRMAEVRSGITSEVDSFAKDPANPYFDEVSTEVATLLQRGVVGTLKEAYEKAIWLNPNTRMKESARIAAEQAAKTAKETEQRLAQVRTATAAKVKTRARSGSVTTPLGSLDDTLNEAFAKIKARH